MSGAWVIALLQPSEQIENGFSGELCAESAAEVSGEAGSSDGEAQAHEVAVGHNHMAGTLRWMTDRQDGEASPEQRVSGIGYLDLVRARIWRVLEGGTMLLGRSTLWIALICVSCFAGGCVTGCCSV